MDTSISTVRTWPLTRSMRRPWVPHAPEMHITVVEVTDDQGNRGRGFSWTPTIGSRAIRALIDHDIADFVVGRPTDPVRVWDQLWRHLHEVGGGGMTTIAMAGVDLALWDMKARRAHAGLPEVLGARHRRLPAYGSGVNLHYGIQELADQVQRWVEAGFSAVKLKVGSDDLRRDVARVGLAREILGADRKLMIDANQRWDLATAERAVIALAEFDLEWIEEPLRADDTSGYAELARRIARSGPGVPIAAGENFHTIHRFRDVIRADGAQILQPNAIRVGGITPFLRIADLVRESGLRLAPHVLPDLHGQLAASLPEEVWVEDVEDAGLHFLGFLRTASPVRVEGGSALIEAAHGLGLEFSI